MIALKTNKYYFTVILILSILTAQAKAKIDIKAYGADNTGKKEVSKIFQNAVDYLYRKGGGVLYVPQGIYLFRYPVFLRSNIKISGQGQGSVILANISISEGRCAFVVGNSYEVNEHTIDEWRKKNIRAWPINKKFKDIEIPEGMEIKSQDKRFITRNSSVENLLIKFDYTNCKSDWGGYGIQFSNAANCTAKNIWTINACQAIGIGSDTSPATPGCTNVFCYNVHVIRPDPVHTYYAIGFIANSNNCGIIGADSFTGCTPGTDDGSLISLNFTTNCTIRNVSGVTGRSKTSEGILINNSYNTKVENISIENSINGIVIFFTDQKLLLKYQGLRNIISNVKLKNCDQGILMMSKYSNISQIAFESCKKPLAFNINATNNLFTGFDTVLNNLPQKEVVWLKDNNTFVR